MSRRAVGARRAFLFSVGFVLGMATVDAAVGGLFGFVGYAVIGLALLRLVHISWPRIQISPQPVNSFGAAYALGIPFGLSTYPVCTPMVLPMLGAAAAIGEAWLGAALLFVFGLACGVPPLIAGSARGTIKHLHRATPFVPKLERAGGVLLLLAALYFAYQSAAYVGFVPPFQFLFEG